MSVTCEQIARAALGEPTKRAGAELLWLCPNHEDKHESLSINPRKNVFLCAPCNTSGTAWQFASFVARLDPGDKQGVTAWLKVRGLLNGRQTAKASLRRGPCVAEYVYRQTNGNPFARKLRFEPGSDGRKKDFAWERCENEVWIHGLAGLKTPLYRLPEIQNEPRVFLTEGEKDADAGAKIGLPTTTSGGTGTFRPDHTETLCGKDVVIVADADDPGRKHAHNVAHSLFGKVESLKVLELPGGKDLSDWVQRGGTAEDLVDLIQRAPEWRPQFIDGSKVLDAILAYIRRFVSLSESQARVLALWVCHTYAFSAAIATPYLAITSAEKQSGKTRLLEVLETLVLNPWLTGKVTPAVLSRKIDAEHPTLLLDESDAAFGGDKEYSEALRGILNTGHRRGGKASCCAGQGASISYRDFSTFCPKAIAGIGKLPDTVADRAIPIRLKRAAPGESVERFRIRDINSETADLRDQIKAWCTTVEGQLNAARPDLPDTLSDRQQDGAEPLLAIADAAGGEWPQFARAALVQLCAEAQASDDSIGKLLLSDIRRAFESLGTDRLPSVALVRELVENESSPWSEWSHGKPLTPAGLARLLRPYGIAPHSIRVEDRTPKGYARDDFHDTFRRYLPAEATPSGSSPAPQGATPQQTNTDAASGDFLGRNTEVPVAAPRHETLNENGLCCGVAVSGSAAVTAGVEEDL